MNNIVGMLHDVVNDRYHPIIFAPSLESWSQSKTNVHRYFLLAWHGAGFEARAKAKEWIVCKCVRENARDMSDILSWVWDGVSTVSAVIEFDDATHEYAWIESTIRVPIL